MPAKKIADAQEIGGKWRVVGAEDRSPLKNKDEAFVDGGGYPLPNFAKTRAKEINDFYAKLRGGEEEET